LRDAASIKVCLRNKPVQSEAKGRSAKATEAEVAQRAMPPRATPTQCLYCLARRASAMGRFISLKNENAVF
jgi:hypothetical protein